MRIIINWLVSALVILIAAYLLPGVHVENLFVAFIVAIVLGILNAIIKPVLVLLTLPLTFATLGLFIFVINAVLVLLATIIVHGFQVDNFWWALLFSIVVSLLNWFLQRVER